MRPSPLPEIQSQLLAALHGAGASAEAFDRGLFLEPPSGSIEGRWAIYRNAYEVRLVEAIQNDYPAVARVTGPAPFRALCQRYIEACPPRSHDIGRAGERSRIT